MRPVPSPEGSPIGPGAIDTQIARHVVAGDEEAFEASAAAAIGRIGQPEEIASAVLWLCSPNASYVVGHPLVIDGGLTVA
jgi:NAD(P)-dependent dehydrogenase (short-subunit alcohol dehydrogenase family)